MGAESEVPRKTVLIVDDEPHIRRLVQIKLARLGVAVVEARDGLDAWEKLPTTRPDLVILDIMMPKLDGHAFLRKVRESAEWRDLPVVMVTAVREEADRRAALDLGALDVVMKPFQTDELVAVVKKHLEGGA